MSACESDSNYATDIQYREEIVKEEEFSAGEEIYTIETLWTYDYYYSIWRLGEELGNSYKDWRYEIVDHSGNVIASEITNSHEPKITVQKSQVLRLKLGYGSNETELQYFDISRGKCSQKFFIMEGYADYIDTFYSVNNKYQALVAYPHFISRSKTVIAVRSIFDDSLYLEIDEGFMSVLGGVNNMQFLRENELYIDYEIKTEDGEFINKRAVAIFDSEGYTYKELDIN